MGAEGVQEEIRDKGEEEMAIETHGKEMFEVGQGYITPDVDRSDRVVKAGAVAPEFTQHQQNKREQLFALHNAICSDALALMRKKNVDYGGKDDPFRNFHLFGGLGILVRMSDKIARLRSFEERGEFAVENESLKDTVIDLCNYAILYYAYKGREKKPQ